ncbi:MAG: MMPL family transporter [Desulfobacterales bacterium]|jgi:predicted RND superfamily exporter protein
MPKTLAKHFSSLSVLEWILSRPLVVILAASAVTVFFALHIPSLSFHTSVYDLIIEDLPEATRYDIFKSEFGSDEIIRVVVKADNIFDTATFRKIATLSDALAAIKGVRRVLSLPEIKRAVDTAGRWNMQDFMKRVAPVELFRKNLISKDYKVTAITLVLDDNVEQESVIRDVNQIIAAEPRELSLYQIGMPLVSQALAGYTVKDFLRLPPLTLLLIVLLLFVLFRNFVCLLLPLMCVSLALIWTFGLLSLLRIPLSILTMIVPVFLIAVGTAYCLHIISDYRTRSQHLASRKKVVISTFSSTALPCALAVFTTIIGLGALFVNRIQAIHEFALFSCFGMFSLLITILAVLPAVLVLVPVPLNTASRASRLDNVIERFLDLIVTLNLHHQKKILSLIGILIIIAAAGVFLIKIETNPVGYFKEGTPVKQNFHDIHRDLSGSFPVNVVLDGRDPYYFEDPAHLAAVKGFQDYLETLPKVDKTVSFADYVMLVNYALNNYDPAHYVLPGEPFEVRMAINNYKVMLGEDLFSSFMTPQLNRANILLLTHMSSSREFLKAKDAILAYARHHFPKTLNCEVTGFGIAVSASSHLLTSGQVKSISISLILIFCIMLLMFLSVKVGLIALLPIFFPIIINFGFMGWLGIRLSMITSLIASIAIGLAVDDAIHYLHRYNQEFKHDLNKDRALRDTIRKVGKPITFTTITIGIGFFILLFSHFKPTAIFGFLMVLTMLAALVGDLLILPALMLHVELVTAWDLLKLMPTASGMSAGVAHELMQPLTAIKMGSDFLARKFSQKAEITEEQISHIVQKISHQADRASEIVNRLRTIGEHTGFNRARVNINDPIKDVIAIVRYQFSLDDIEIRLDLDETLPPISGHKNRLGQVIYNMVVNAGEAIVEQKKFADDNRSHGIQIRTFKEGNHVVVTIVDTGLGVSRSNIPRIYEPFFTTKTTGQGKGLGLTISNEIVRAYGGHIEVDSEQDKGTTFKVSFPCLTTEDGGGATAA